MNGWLNGLATTPGPLSFQRTPSAFKRVQQFLSLFAYILRSLAILSLLKRTDNLVAIERGTEGEENYKKCNSVRSSGKFITFFCGSIGLDSGRQRGGKEMVKWQLNEEDPLLQVIFSSVTLTVLLSYKDQKKIKKLL